jgi:hypothetical protein
MANPVKDIKLEDDDLFINGDFKVSFSDQQHIIDIIESNVGSWKEYPLVGVGINNYLGSIGKEQEIKRQVKLQLENDGYRVNEVKIANSNDINWSVDAERV